MNNRKWVIGGIGTKGSVPLPGISTIERWCIYVRSSPQQQLSKCNDASVQRAKRAGQRSRVYSRRMYEAISFHWHDNKKDDAAEFYIVVGTQRVHVRSPEKFTSRLRSRSMTRKDIYDRSRADIVENTHHVRFIYIRTYTLYLRYVM